MNTTVEALKNLYVALGGALTDYYSGIAGGIPVSDYVLIPDCNSAIVKVAPAAIAAVLPEVSESDEGKVLKVNSEGKWAVGDDNITA